MRALLLASVAIAACGIHNARADVIWTYTVDLCTYDGGASCPGNLVGKAFANLDLPTTPVSNTFTYQADEGTVFQDTGNLNFSLTLGFAELSPTQNSCAHLQLCYWNVAYSATDTSIADVTLDYGDGMDDTIELGTFAGTLDPNQGCGENDYQCQVTGTWTVSNPPNNVPEPSSMTLMLTALGLAAGSVAFYRRLG